MYIDNPQLFSGSLSGSIILDQAFLEDNLVPNADATIDLGSSSQRYRTLHAANISASIHTSSITNFSTEVSRSAAAEGFSGGGGGGSYTLTNTDIAGLQVGIVSGSLGGLVDTGSIQNFDNHVSASAAASGFGAGGGGSYTLTNSDIQGLGAGIVSSSGDVAALRAGIFSGSLGGLVDTGSIQNFDNHVSASAAASGFGSGGSGGGSADLSSLIERPNFQHYTVHTSSVGRLSVTTISDLDTNISWNRIGGTLGITSSVPHNLVAGEAAYVVNMGDTSHQRLDVNSTSGSYHAVLAGAQNSGDTSGTQGSWCPAISGSAIQGGSDPGINQICFYKYSNKDWFTLIKKFQWQNTTNTEVDVNCLIPTASYNDPTGLFWQGGATEGDADHSWFDLDLDGSKFTNYGPTDNSAGAEITRGNITIKCGTGRTEGNVESTGTPRDLIKVSNVDDFDRNFVTVRLIP